MNVSTIKTTQDRHLVLEDLASLEKKLYKTESNDVLKSIKSISSQVLDSLDNKDVTVESIKELREQLQKLPLVTISLASPPSQDQIDLVTEWSRRVLDNKALLEIKVNAHMIAGIQIVWRGIMYDGSFSTKIHQQLKPEKTHE